MTAKVPVVVHDAAILQAVEAIDSGGAQIVFVVDAARRLVGAVTDGDVRRGLLSGKTLEAPVSEIMNPNPVQLGLGASREHAVALMHARDIRQIPIVDSEGRLVGMELRDANADGRDDTLVVLMAGGLGTRLRPLTETIPKPMVPVGGRPLIETILRGFVDQGFRNFAISLNYKAELVKNHFGDGERFGATIHYLEESKPLGTAGALSLIEKRPKRAVIAMNADILTAIDYRKLLEFHETNEAPATMCVREYTHHSPFGVVRNDGWKFLSIEEKPVLRMSVSAGIYAFAPAVLDLVPNDERFDMPTLFERLKEAEQTPAVFPIHEYWLDVGRFDDLDRAREEFDAVFRS